MGSKGHSVPWFVGISNLMSSVDFYYYFEDKSWRNWDAKQLTPAGLGAKLLLVEKEQHPRVGMSIKMECKIIRRALIRPVGIRCW